MKTKMLAVLLVAGLMLFLGCAERIITPAEQLEFANFNIRVQDWSDQCRADPNSCGRGMANMAAEMQQWALVITGGDPNLSEVSP
jgi:hypothetical protein